MLTQVSTPDEEQDLEPNVFTGLMTVLDEDGDAEATVVWATPADLATVVLEAFDKPVSNIVLALTKAHDPDSESLLPRLNDPRSEP